MHLHHSAVQKKGLQVMLIDIHDEAALACLKEQLANVTGLMAGSGRQTFHSDVALMALAAKPRLLKVMVYRYQSCGLRLHLQLWRGGLFDSLAQNF